MIVPHCIPIYAANPFCLARSNLDALSSYAFPVQFTNVFIHVDAAFYTLDDRKDETCYIWVNIWLPLYVGYCRKWRSSKTNCTLISALILPLITYTLRNTHMHTHIHIYTFLLKWCHNMHAVLWCIFLLPLPGHLSMSEYMIIAHHSL